MDTGKGWDAAQYAADCHGSDELRGGGTDIFIRYAAGSAAHAGFLFSLTGRPPFPVEIHYTIIILKGNDTYVYDQHRNPYGFTIFEFERDLIRFEDSNFSGNITIWNMAV